MEREREREIQREWLANTIDKMIVKKPIACYVCPPSP